MAGQSDAADDLIAELAKLMAQDANDTPQPKPASPSPFTVRIPGEPANTVAPRQEETHRAPQPAPVQPAATPTPAAAAPVRQQPAQPAPTPDRDRFSFAFDAPPRREPVAPAASAPASTPASTPVPPVVADVPAEAAAPVAVQPAPEPIEHDSIADLIAAELANEQQPAPQPANPTAPLVATEKPVPAEPSQRPQPTNSANSGWQPVNIAPNLAGQERPPQPQLRTVSLQPTPRAEPSRSEQDKFKVPPVFGLGAAPAAQPVQAKAPEPVRVQSPATVTEPSVAAAPVQAQPSPTPAPAPSVNAPTPPQARTEAGDDIGLDPIDEIESLIGKAVRVDLEGGSQPAPKPERTALRSLATPQVPKQPAPQPRGISSADEAILAAAQASGAEIGWVEAPEVDEVEPRPSREKRRRAMPSIGFSRALAGPLIAIVLLLAAGFGLYWVLGLGGTESGPPPLLTADATPVKETPAPQPEAATEQQSVVFNEMEGVVPGAEEQLVSRDQADVNEVTQTPVAPNVSSEGLANRKVRTVTVRPDGTIVSADNSLAGSTILPVDRPDVPEVPGAQTASPELLAAQGAVPPAANALVDPAAPAPTPVPGAPAPGAAALPPAPDAAAVPPAADTAVLPPPDAAALPAEPAPPPAPVVTPGATVPAVDAAGNVLPGKTTVIPLQRPSSFAQRPQADATSVTPAEAVVEQETAAVAAPAQLPPPPSGQPSTSIPGATEVAAVSNDAPAYVQLASQRTEEEARATAQGLVTRFGPLFGGANMEVQRVDLGDRGIFYRVRVPANSAEQASNICTNVKAAGGDCFTM
jgi:hypothetical protein